MSARELVIVALSGGVDSAVAALRLRAAGHEVQCLHMTNWEDDDGYCETARDFQDARRLCRSLDLPLHRVNFAREYREQVFAHFLAEHRRGRTPNPDVLCNREIKFGVLRGYAQRLGAHWLATGHYARLRRVDGRPQLLKGVDTGKDQSYFLHKVHARDLDDALFPLGGSHKTDVRAEAARAGLTVAAKRDSTGICFIGERPFREFLKRFLPQEPGAIVDPDGSVLGEHLGLAFYTLGQRHGLGIGGRREHDDAPWYVAGKDAERNELLIVQGHDHPLLYQDLLQASELHWIGDPPAGWQDGDAMRCVAKTRYRQPDQPCTVQRSGQDGVEVLFDQGQRAITPGQSVVFYLGERCLGGATIDSTARRRPSALRAVG
jgi:tRNA-uridine 2-sulfurtransferase